MFPAWFVLFAAFAPAYTADSVVNAASSQPNSFAPNSYISIYGTELSFATRAIEANDMSADELPTCLLNTNVRVAVGGLPAHLLYISPTQINALLPSVLTPGSAEIAVFRNGVWGPLIKVDIRPHAPAFFLADPSTVIATRPDGSLITRDLPATPGEVIILYANGLGATYPPQAYGRLAVRAARITDFDKLAVSLDGEVLPAHLVEYAGITPGFAGLYQINLRLPAFAAINPEIRVQIDADRSPEGVRLPFRPSSPQPAASKPR